MTTLDIMKPPPSAIEPAPSNSTASRVQALAGLFVTLAPADTLVRNIDDHLSEDDAKVMTGFEDAFCTVLQNLLNSQSADFNDFAVKVIALKAGIDCDACNPSPNLLNCLARDIAALRLGSDDRDQSTLERAARSYLALEEELAHATTPEQQNHICEKQGPLLEEVLDRIAGTDAELNLKARVAERFLPTEDHEDYDDLHWRVMRNLVMEAKLWGQGE